MTLRGFGAAIDDEEKDHPIPGTFAHLRWVEEKKKREAEAVDNSLSISEQAITKTVTVTKPVTVTEKVRVTETVIAPTITESVRVTEMITDGAYVSLENNWMKLDLDVFRVMPRLSGIEFKVYLFFLSRSYGAYPDSKNICSVTHSMIADIIGIDAIPPISRCVKSLIQQGFLKRQFKGEGKGDLSIYRVFLPSEIPNIGGNTKIKLLPN
jgi:hypothetical protein